MSDVGLKIYAIKPVDEDWIKMKAVHDACQKANIKIPDAVAEYFDWMIPGDTGMVQEIATKNLDKYEKDMVSGFDLKLSDVPKGTKKIRVVINYDA